MARPKTTIDPVQLNLSMERSVRDLGKRLADESNSPSLSHYVSRLLLDANAAVSRVYVDMTVAEHNSLVEIANRHGVGPNTLMKSACAALLDNKASLMGDLSDPLPDA